MRQLTVETVETVEKVETVVTVVTVETFEFDSKVFSENNKLFLLF